VIAPVACEVPAVSGTEADCVFVDMVAASLSVCVNVCAVVAGLAKLAGPVLPSTDCSKVSAIELLAAEDSLLLLWVGTSVRSSVGSSLDSSVVTRTASAVA
jgi:hypothetical protein